MFRRSTVRYGATPQPETPYQKAGQAWDERIGSARVQAKNWRLAFFGMLLLSFGLAAGLKAVEVLHASRAVMQPDVCRRHALVLIDTHHLPVRRQRRPAKAFHPQRPCSSLGTIRLTGGFLGAVYGLMARGLPGGRRRDLRAPHDRAALRDHGALVVLLAVLFGTIGGFSILLSIAGFSPLLASPLLGLAASIVKISSS